MGFGVPLITLISVTLLKKIKTQKEMIKQLIKIGFVIAIIYGLFKLFMIWPVESTILIGSLMVSLIIYWLIKLE